MPVSKPTRKYFRWLHFFLDKVSFNYIIKDKARPTDKENEMTPKEDEVTTSMIVPKELWEQAKIRAAMERISLGELFRRALKEYLAKKESKKKGGK